MSSTSEHRLNELALSMHHNPGVYAVLLGAGISMAAQVPSAWEIVRDLIRKKAHLKGIHPLPEGDQLDQWYRDTYGTEPDYSTIIEEAEPTIAGQRALLQRYFEPTEEDREQGRKQPTQAHHAIAKLAKEGFIRIIITTNFDPLMEQALDASGVPFFSITSTDEIPAAEPYAHGGVFLIKVHGDYRKANVRNSNADLTAYPQAMKDLLCRIFDEFGLITCGWSGTWDHALRECIEHSPNRRYLLYWTSYSQSSQVAQTLIQNRKGRVIEGMRADGFFTQLESKVLGLKNAHWTPPQNLELLEAELKLCMSHSERYEIRMQDFLEEEVRRFNQAIWETEGWTTDTRDPQLSLLMKTNMLASTRLEHILGTLLKYDHTEKYLSLWRTAFMFGMRMDPRPELYSEQGVLLKRLAFSKLVFSFWMLALRYQRWTYLKEIINWGYFTPAAEFRSFLSIVAQGDQATPLVDVVAGKTEFLNARIIIRDLSSLGLQKHFNSPPPFFFYLTEMMLNLLALQRNFTATPGLYLKGEHVNESTRRFIHMWFRNNAHPIQELLQGDVRQLLGQLQGLSYNMANRYEINHDPGAHVDIANLL